MPDKVLFDTTTLCSAILNLDSISMNLLEMGRTGWLEPVITEEVIIEWVRNCRQGIGGVVFQQEHLEEFCQLIEPLLSPEAVAIVELTRAQSPLYPITEHEGITIIQHPDRQKTTKTHMRDERTLALTDIGDFHLVAAALKYRCKYLCTYNMGDLPDGLEIGSLTVIRPERLYRKLING